MPALAAPASPPPSSPRVPPLGARAGWGDFAFGFSLPFRAIRVIAGSPRLTALSLVSSAVTAAALIALSWALFTYTDDLVSLAWAKPTAWYAVALWYLVVAVAFVLLLVVGANTVPLLLLAPLQDPISEATEASLGNFSPPPFSFGRFWRGAVASVSHTLQRIGLLLLGQAVLLPLVLIPGVGSIAWTVLGALWTMWWLATEYVGGAMVRYLYTFREVQSALRARARLAMGFGAAVYVLLWIPVLNLFFIPLAIAAGTLLFCSLRQAGCVRAPR